MIKGIYRNFGGFENSEKTFSDEFFKKYQEKERLNNNDYLHINYNVLDRIKDNIESGIESRYLLLITENGNETDKKNNDGINNEILLKYILQGKKYTILSDENINKYENKNNAILNLLLQIKMLMKKEIILILKNLDILYPSLYELFNKNFTQYFEGGPKYTQISYESQYSLEQVNEKFRIIVMVNKDKLKYEEKPFLNRFEKQIFSIKIILNEEKIEIVNDNYNIAEEIKRKISFSNLDYLNKDLFYFFMSKYYNEEKDKALELFISDLVTLFPQEIIYCLNDNSDEKIKKMIKKRIKILLIYNIKNIMKRFLILNHFYQM